MLAIASILLIGEAVDHPYTQSLRQFMNQAANSIYVLPQHINLQLREIAGHLSTKESYQKKLAQLSGDLVAARQHVSITEDLTAENARLRQLLNMSERHNSKKYIAAQAYGNVRNAGQQSVSINKGHDDGAFIGQAVVDGHGIVGQIISAQTSHSNVLLITDSGHATPVKIARTGYATIAQGTGQNNLKVLYVTRTIDIQVGDQLLSSGMGDRFPAGVPVAVVSQIRSNSEGEFREVYATPVAKLRQLATLLLLWIA